MKAFRTKLERLNARGRETNEGFCSPCARKRLSVSGEIVRGGRKPLPAGRRKRASARALDLICARCAAVEADFIFFQRAFDFFLSQCPFLLGRKVHLRTRNGGMHAQRRFVFLLIAIHCKKTFHMPFGFFHGRITLNAKVRIPRNHAGNHNPLQCNT